MNNKNKKSLFDNIKVASNAQDVSDDRKKEQDKKVDEYLSKLLDKCKISKEKPWLDCIVSETRGSKKLIGLIDRCGMPITCFDLIPIPFHKILNKDTKVEMNTMLFQAMATISTHPACFSFPILTPSLAILLTSRPSFIKIVETEQRIENLLLNYKKIRDKYNKEKKKNNGGIEFFETGQAMKMQQLYIILEQYLNEQILDIDSYDSVTWDSISSTVHILQFYFRAKYCIEASCGMTKEMDAIKHKAALHRIVVANKKLSAEWVHFETEFIEQFSDIVDDFSRQLCNTSEVNNTYIIDNQFNDGRLLNGMINYTFNIIQSLERWILTAIGLNSKIHSGFACYRETLPDFDHVSDNLRIQIVKENKDLFDTRRSVSPFLWMNANIQYNGKDIITNNKHISGWSIDRKQILSVMITYSKLYSMFRYRSKAQNICNKQWNIIHNNVGIDQMYDDETNVVLHVIDENHKSIPFLRLKKK